jgi:hypothetical protein
MTSEKCIACHRIALPDNKYCLFHKKASDSIADHYNTWVHAYGGLSWEDFLSKLSKMQETGGWVKEVIAVEMKK